VAGLGRGRHVVSKGAAPLALAVVFVAGQGCGGVVADETMGLLEAVGFVKVGNSPVYHVGLGLERFGACARSLL
jgi:hypothetical protein